MVDRDPYSGLGDTNNVQTGGAMQYTRQKRKSIDNIVAAPPSGTTGDGTMDFSNPDDSGLIPLLEDI